MTKHSRGISQDRFVLGSVLFLGIVMISPPIFVFFIFTFASSQIWQMLCTNSYGVPTLSLFQHPTQISSDSLSSRYTFLVQCLQGNRILSTGQLTAHHVQRRFPNPSFTPISISFHDRPHLHLIITKRIFCNHILVFKCKPYQRRTDTTIFSYPPTMVLQHIAPSSSLWTILMLCGPFRFISHTNVLCLPLHIKICLPCRHSTVDAATLCR
jgi:hypothetical protein